MLDGINIIDIAVYGIILVSVAAGLYQGLLATAANTAGFYLSLLCAGLFYGGMAEKVKAADKIIPQILYYSETSDMLGSVEVYRTPVAGMTQSGMDSLLQTVNLPHPVGKLYAQNVLGQAYAPMGIDNLGDYLSRTVAEMAVNVSCFLLILLGVYIGVTLIINMVHFVFRLPSLKAFDGILGGAVGLLRGSMLAYATLMLLPVVLSMLPVQQVREIVEASKTVATFYEHNFLLDMIRSTIG